MPECSFCQNHFCTFKALQLHFNIVHNYQNDRILGCLEENCLRSFENWKDYRKHFTRTHNSTCPSHYSSITDNVESTENENIIDIESNNEDCLSDDINFVLQSEPVETNYVNFMRDKLLHFTAKLSANQKFARIHAHNIILDVSEILNFCANIMKSKIVSELSQKDITNYTQIVNHTFDQSLQILQEFSSEHRRFNLLKETGNLIRAEEYVICRY